MLGIDSARNCINGARPERPSRAVSWRRTAMRDVERTEVPGGLGVCRSTAAARGTAGPIPVTGIKTRQKGESRDT